MMESKMTSVVAMDMRVNLFPPELTTPQFNWAKTHTERIYRWVEGEEHPKIIDIDGIMAHPHGTCYQNAFV